MLRRTAVILFTGVVIGSLSPVAIAAPTRVATEADVGVFTHCLTTKLDDDGYEDDLWVTNECSYTTERYKVVLANKPDKPCTTIRPGETDHWTWYWAGRFDGLRAC